ncbi:hypothetical protein SK128_016044 [Halocaridina rubra]|uniref:Methyltransferase FkbM domain-containing protein n=1 Tax=Halocaridina rubra TaxID=373956 RepID=A0AAN8WMJ3_HALRR
MSQQRKNRLYLWAGILTALHLRLWLQKGYLFRNAHNIDNNIGYTDPEISSLLIKKKILEDYESLLIHDDQQLYDHLRRMIEQPPAMKAHHHPINPDIPAWINVTSYNRTESNLRALCSSTYKGTFVEIGAQDGLWLSNTWWLEATMGWRGLLVEGDPKNYANLRESPRLSPTLPTCACEGKSARMEKMLRIKHPAPITSDIGKTQRGRTMLAKFATPTDLYLGETWNATCYPLMSVLAASGYKKIDLLVFDTAGGGYEMMEDFLLSNDELGNPYKVQVILYQDSSVLRSNTLPQDVQNFGYTYVLIDSSHHLLIHKSMTFSVV